MEYSDFREGKTHGDAVFPFNIYPCAIPQMFAGVMTHWHDEFEIIYIKKGTGTVTVDRDYRTLSAPAVVFILPGQLHSIAQYENSCMEYENIIFHPHLLSEGQGSLFDREYLEHLWEGSVSIPTFLLPEDPNFDTFTEPLIACDMEAEKHALYYPIFVKSQLFLLCYRLLTNCPQETNAALRRNSSEELKQVLTYLYSHYAEKVQVSDIAAYVGFSKSHLMRYFKDTMGCSLVTYLNEYRLSQAESKLRSTNQSVLDIAQESGFPNLSYFIRTFKDKYGVTPLKYRNVHCHEKD